MIGHWKVEIGINTRGVFSDTKTVEVVAKEGDKETMLKRALAKVPIKKHKLYSITKEPILLCSFD